MTNMTGPSLLRTSPTFIDAWASQFLAGWVNEKEKAYVGVPDWVNKRH